MDKRFINPGNEMYSSIKLKKSSHLDKVH